MKYATCKLCGEKVEPTPLSFFNHLLFDHPDELHEAVHTTHIKFLTFEDLNKLKTFYENEQKGKKKK